MVDLKETLNGSPAHRALILPALDPVLEALSVVVVASVTRQPGHQVLGFVVPKAYGAHLLVLELVGIISHPRQRLEDLRHLRLRDMPSSLGYQISIGPDINENARKSAHNDRVDSHHEIAHEQDYTH